MDQSISFFFCYRLFIYSIFKDLQAYGDNKAECSGQFPFPIIDDSDRRLAKQLGMIDPAEFDTKGLPLTARAVCLIFFLSSFVFIPFSKVFFIGPDKKVKASLLYPATSGRNFELGSSSKHFAF